MLEGEQMDTAQRLRRLRRERGLSQDSVASALGIDRTTYVKYENGGSIKQSLQKMADFFGVSTDYLLGRDEESMILREHRYGDNVGNLGFDVPRTTDLLTGSELAHMEKYRAITPEQRDAVDCLMDY